MTYFRTVSQQTLDIIRNDIIQGALEPGEKLNESVLATRYQISRTPLREAIRQLQAEGLVEAIPNKGARVACLSMEDIHDYFEVRQVMEGYALHLICKKISDNDLQRLKKIVTQLKDNYYIANHLDNFKLITEFYSILHANCTNSHLQKTLQTMTRRFAQLRFVLVQTKGVIKLFEMYAVLTELIEKRESVEAEKYHTEALKMCKEIVFDDVLKSYPKIIRN